MGEDQNVHPKPPQYAWPWCETIVTAYLETYPRASVLLLEILGITRTELIRILQKDRTAWERFKKMTKVLNNWLCRMGEPFGKPEAQEALLASLATYMHRERLLHKNLVLTNPWEHEILEGHVLIGGIGARGTPRASMTTLDDDPGSSDDKEALRGRHSTKDLDGSEKAPSD